jgi:uncharacterized membrane protein
MSDPTEPPRSDGPADEPAPPPPPPPPPETPSPPPGDAPYGAAPGYGAPPGDPYAGAGGGYGAPPGDPYGAAGGSYGVPPPGPSGQPASATGPYSPTGAISYGWRKFVASPGTLLVPMIVVFVGVLVVSFLVNVLLHALYHASGFSTFLFTNALASAVISLATQVLAAGLYKGATRVTDGRPFSTDQLFDDWDKTQVVIAALIIAAATFVGTFLCFVPGLIVGFFTQFTLLFVVDKHLEAVEAIKASVKLVVDNLGNTILFYLLALVVLAVGAILCGVGLLVAAPVALIGLAYTYRRLQGEPVVE